MQSLRKSSRSADPGQWAVWVLVCALLSGCLSYPMPEDEEEDSRMTIIACFFARCENDLSEGRETADNEGLSK